MVPADFGRETDRSVRSALSGARIRRMPWPIADAVSAIRLQRRRPCRPPVLFETLDGGRSARPVLPIADPAAGEATRLTVSRRFAAGSSARPTARWRRPSTAGRSRLPERAISPTSCGGVRASSARRLLRAAVLPRTIRAPGRRCMRPAALAVGRTGGVGRMPSPALRGTRHAIARASSAS
jgi:hypothetical protein